MPMRRFLCCFVLLLSGCVGYPTSVRPVEDFVLDRYLGKWYEIARLDHSFERGMQQVTAEYSLNADGSVRVSWVSDLAPLCEEGAYADAARAAIAATKLLAPRAGRWGARK